MEPSVFRPPHTQRNTISSERSRLSAAKRGYDRRWRKYRTAYLSTHPWCVECLKPIIDTNTMEQIPGRHVLATEIDHIQEVQQGQKDPLFWESSNHQPLCKTHHSVKTAKRK